MRGTDSKPTRSGGFGRAVLRRLPLLGTLLGLGLGIWLVATNDLSAIGDAFARVGILGLAAVVATRAAIVLACGLAWARVLDALSLVPLAAFLILRFVREGINVLLPVASVGGDVLGGRLLTFWSVTGALAAASILVDMLLQVGTQFLFTLGGALLLMRFEGEAAAALSRWALHALTVAAVLLAAFFAVQRSGAARFVERRLAALSRRFVREAEPEQSRSEPSGSVGDALDAVWAPGRAGRLAQSFLLHLLGWCLGALEVGIALACMGVEVSLTQVIVLEALAQAVKSAAFVVPSGLGVQEGGFIVAGGLFGIDAETAIALSLVKRVPDVVLGLPALLVWQNLEAKRAAVRPDG